MKYAPLKTSDFGAYKNRSDARRPTSKARGVLESTLRGSREGQQRRWVVFICPTVSKSLVWTIRQYQHWISSWFPPVCRFYPSCSQYTIECFERFPVFFAFRLSCKRIFRCHPFNEGGSDPVPFK